MTQGHDVSTPRRLQFNLETYLTLQPGGGGGGLLPYMGYMGICRGEGYGFGEFTLV